ncbi:MAG: HD domain-containing protein [Tannerellaceae bacterium]|jgi:putative nucleotidyltransferase with HDIG domain|nr:HD domain-containing protein [Tannerellaceae bacterium]
MIREDVLELWQELLWINDEILLEKTAQTWALALDKSVLTIDDLQTIPFTLLCGDDLQVSFMEHKRCVVHVSYEAGKKMNSFFTTNLPVNMDILVSGAILADVGKLLEYELKDGKAVTGTYGKYLRHPFSGVSLAEQCGVPAEVCHIIATHAAEGDLVKRTTEACIVHHADFMTFLPFKDRLKL